MVLHPWSNVVAAVVVAAVHPWSNVVAAVVVAAVVVVGRFFTIGKRV